jgi:hypothetical protein
MIQVLPNTRFAVQVACALRLYQPVLIRGSLETVDNVLDESEFANAIEGPQTPMLMNARRVADEQHYANCYDT